MKFLVILSLASIVYSNAAVLPEYEDIVPIMDLAVSPATLGGRITNGQTAGINQFPYQVGLSIRRGIKGSWCGGSLIGEKWVLTAQHCTTGASSITVYLGSNDRNSPQIERKANKVIEHDGYSATTLSHDISLIEIDSVPYSASIQNVRLPTISATYHSFAGDYTIASGWGRMSDSPTATIARNMYYARLQVITNSVCANSYGSSIITERTLCVSTPGGTSTCQGDSGGPLVLESNKELVGVTSFVAGKGCSAGFPSGFVRVTGYLQWIKANTGIFY